MALVECHGYSVEYCQKKIYSVFINLAWDPMKDGYEDRNIGYHAINFLFGSIVQMQAHIMHGVPIIDTKPLRRSSQPPSRLA